MSAEIKRYEVWVADRDLPDDMLMVTLREHLASHAFDEAEERAAFEDAYNTLELHGGPNSWTGRWEYDHPHVNSLWQGWLRCAKSRAKRFGGAE